MFLRIICSTMRPVWTPGSLLCSISSSDNGTSHRIGAQIMASLLYEQIQHSCPYPGFGSLFLHYGNHYFFSDFFDMRCSSERSLCDFGQVTKALCVSLPIRRMMVIIEPTSLNIHESEVNLYMYNI